MPEPSAPLTGERVIAYWVGPQQPLSLFLHQITAESAILESRILWEIGEEVPLELWFPGEVRHRARIRVLGQALGPVMGMTIKFIELSPSAKSALGRYLAREPAQET